LIYKWRKCTKTS